MSTRDICHSWSEVMDTDCVIIQTFSSLAADVLEKPTFWADGATDESNRHSCCLNEAFFVLWWVRKKKKKTLLVLTHWDLGLFATQVKAYSIFQLIQVLKDVRESHIFVTARDMGIYRNQSTDLKLDANRQSCKLGKNYYKLKPWYVGPGTSDLT